MQHLQFGQKNKEKMGWTGFDELPWDKTTKKNCLKHVLRIFPDLFGREIIPEIAVFPTL